MKWKRLVQNTILLTGTTLVMRCTAMVFQVWLVGRIGAAGIGLYQLVLSVGMLASTVAVSGIRFASTRLIAEELGLGRPESVGAAAGRCLGYALCFGTAAAALLAFLAQDIGFLWIGDARTVPSLRLLALSLPFMALSAVFCGYFTAVGRVLKSTAAQILEQLLRIAFVVVLLQQVNPENITASCAAVTKGATMGEALSCLVLALLYVQDRRRFRSQEGRGGEKLTGRMLGIALPLALSAYARSSLSTLEHLLVPRQLRLSGLSSDRALEGYGSIQGMIFPILTFPSCLLTALAELLVPELTAEQMRGRLLAGSALFGLVTAAVLWIWAEPLTQKLYGDAQLGTLLRQLCPLVPVIYLDIVTDGCLKGLGQMLHSMLFNILDAALGVTLVVLLLPTWALTGYIAMIYITELGNAALSLQRLLRVIRAMGR